MRAKRPLGQSRSVELEVAGQPLHSRALSLTLREGRDGGLDVEATILDLRKRSFVPVAGDLQAAGVIHHMQVRASIERGSCEVRELEVLQPTVALEPSAATRGESCRDPVGRLQALVGRRIDAGFASRANAAAGGPRGCTHVLTATQLMGSTVPWAMERESALFGEPPRRRPGERLFRRDLVFDGLLEADSRVSVAAQLSDLHFRPAPEPTPPLERFAGQLELRLLAAVEVPSLRVATLRAAERRRGRRELGSDDWRPLDDALAGALGLVLRPGVSRTLVGALEGRPDERPLLTVLLNLMPACFQCLAPLSESWMRGERLAPGVVGLGSHPDSCYMWRSHGPLGS